MADDTQAEISAVEMQIFELNAKLVALQGAHQGEQVPNYTFATENGEATLLDLFADQDRLMLIHNMGQGCRYCTLWADGFNGLLPHLESALSVVLVSKDPPDVQRKFANARGWRFRLASHGAGDYMREQTVQAGVDNMPGVVVYARLGDAIVRKNSAAFGPGDRYCAQWSLLGLAGLGESEWTPQYRYWTPPTELDDGGDNRLD